MTPYVLMLPRWYPNPIHPADGNFIQKHIECIASNANVCVLFVKGIRDIEDSIKVTKQSDSHVDYIYFYKLNRGPFFWFINPLRYFLCQYKLYKRIKGEIGAPTLCHVHVLARSSLLAYFLQFFKIPYIVSEHWSGYYKESRIKLSILKRTIYRFIIKRSSANSAVSYSLAKSIQDSLSPIQIEVIPNVVDDVFLVTEVLPANLEKKKIVHISNLKNEVKQTDKILIALNQIGGARSDFELIIIGDGPDRKELETLASSLSYLKTNTTFTGDITQREMASLLKDAYLTVSFSKYETQSIVLLESMAMMVPIIAPNVGGIPEYANEFGGLFEVNSIEGFKQKIIEHLDKNESQRNYNLRNHILKNFSCSVVNKKFTHLYQSIIPNFNV